MLCAFSPISHTIPRLLILFSLFASSAESQGTTETAGRAGIDVAGFYGSSHHWYDIEDEMKIITPLPGQGRYKKNQIRAIADNILLYQKSNGGWPKNYDMLAILTRKQREALLGTKDQANTTFDNGTTHSHIEYLAKAYARLGEPAYKEACLRGLDFIFSAQYPNGGWPQGYPDTSGYRKFITFNDGALIGIMSLLHHILQDSPDYRFVDGVRRAKVRRAYDRGLRCILSCQVVQNGRRTVWGQQHDNVDLRPREARNFEPASLTSMESADIVLFLMEIERPDRCVIDAVEGAVNWFEKSKITGIRVRDIKAPVADYRYMKNVGFDRAVVEDPGAPPIWARIYELGTNVPLFCNRDGKSVYSLADVERERRTGYAWYTYAPTEVLRRYPAWRSASGDQLTR